MAGQTVDNEERGRDPHVPVREERKMERSRSLLLLVTVPAVLQAACSAAPDAQSAAEGASRGSAQPIYGVGTTTDMTSSSGPFSTVGQISWPKPDGTTGICSGTVVGRQTVLTAAHCFCEFGIVPQLPFTFTLPQVSNQNPNGFNSGISSYVLHPTNAGLACQMMVITGYLPPEHDLAVAYLQTPVPIDLVPDLAQVFLGNEIDYWNAGLFSNGVQIGWGGNVKYSSSAGIGTRRGAPVDVWLWQEDACDKIVFEGSCNDDWEWGGWLDPSWTSVIAKGDSGGPLFMNVGGANPGPLGALVVGVTSGYTNDHQRKATTGYGGDSSGQSNADFLVAAFGGDQDGDGVLDAQDNCPPSTCTAKGIDIAKCANPTQSDADGDGFGDVDACDNCAPSRCAGGKPQPSCANPAQADADGDGWGDICDPCPFNAHGDKTDADGDGVGDSCDTCHSHDDSYALCFQNSDCSPFPPNAGLGTCTKRQHCLTDANTVGHCAFQPDPDCDGLGATCDLCEGWYNPGPEANSNADAESVQSAAAYGDACDPVPVFRLDQQSADSVLKGIKLTQGDGKGPDDLQAITGAPVLGKLLPSSPDQQLKQAVSYFHCDCSRTLPGGTVQLLQASECLNETGGPCDPLGAGTPSGKTAANWRAITVDENGAVPPGGSFSDVFDTTASYTAIRSWHWYDDAIASRIVSRVGTDGFVGTHGVVLAHIEHVAPFAFGTRDSGYQLRDAFSMFDTPLYQETQPQAPPAIVPCLFGGCNPWVMNNPIDPPDSVGKLLGDPALLVASSKSDVVAATSGPSAFNLSDRMAANVPDLLSRGGVWAHSVETGQRLARAGKREGALGLPGDLESGQLPIVLDAHSRILGGTRKSVPIVSGATPNPAGATSNVVSAAYSALEGVAYALVRHARPNQPRSGAPELMRYDAAAHVWIAPRKQLTPTIGGEVLDTAYDSSRQAFYVLYVEDSPAPVGSAVRGARLLRIDLRAWTSAVVGEWPYAGLFARVYLAADDDGGVYLVGSGDDATQVWRFGDPSVGILIPTGYALFLGAAIDRPIATWDKFVLPILRGGHLVFEDLRPNTAGAILACGSL